MTDPPSPGAYRHVTEEQVTKPLPPQAPVPGVSPSTFAQLAAIVEDKKIARWKLIGGAIGGVSAIVVSCSAGVVAVVESARRPPESATSAEVRELQTQLEEAQAALTQSEITKLAKKVDDLTARFDAWQEAREEESATNARQDREIKLLAEITYQHNGDAPSPDWPVPHPQRWFVLNGSPTVHRTDQRWLR